MPAWQSRLASDLASRPAEEDLMHFGLTEEQELLQETADAFVATHCPPEKAKEWDEAERVPVGAVGPHGRARLVRAALSRGLGRRWWRASSSCAFSPRRSAGPASTSPWRTSARSSRASPSSDRAAKSSADRFRDGLLDGRGTGSRSPSASPMRGPTPARCGPVAEHERRRVRASTGRRCGAPGLAPGADDRHVRPHRSWRTQASRASAWSLDRPNDAEGVEIRRTPTLARHLLGTNEVFLKTWWSRGPT